MTQGEAITALIEHIEFLRIDFPGRWSEYLSDDETALLLSTLRGANSEGERR